MVRPGVVRAFVNVQRGVPKRGSEVILRHQIYGVCCFVFRSCRGVHRDIRIENNTIHEADGSPIRVTSAEGVVISGNTSNMPTCS